MMNIKSCCSTSAFRLRILPVCLVATGLWLGTAPATRGEEPALPAPAEGTEPVTVKPSLGTKLLWYVPNRLIDFVDIVRLRLRVGPGLSAGLRATEYASFYGGTHRTGFVGLPGPRDGAEIRPPYGWEREKGLRFFGVDATDTNVHDPYYSATEFTLGAQLLLVGADVGFDPVEMGDFLSGLILRDPAGDDFGYGNPKHHPDQLYPIWQEMMASKPQTFTNFPHRLDYTRSRFNTGLNTGVRQFDTLFAENQDEAQVVPPTRFRFGMYLESEVDEGFSLAFDPDFDIQVDLPNLEANWNVFITGKELDELPGTDPTERDGGALVGVGRKLDRLPIKMDAGVKIKWLPEIFGSLTWRKGYDAGSWKLAPRIKGYWESEDGFGSIASFFGQRWMGEMNRNFIRSVSAGKWTEDTQGFEWEQSLYVGRVISMLEIERADGSFGASDTGNAFALRGSVFGHIDSNDAMDRYRLSFGYRRPLYSDWIFLEIIPELEWKNDRDWETIPKLRIGFDALFWGSPAPKF